VQDVRDELKEGDQLLVKVISIDPSGKIRLSRKALLAEEEAAKPERRRRSHPSTLPGPIGPTVMIAGPTAAAAAVPQARADATAAGSRPSLARRGVRR